MNNLRGLYYCLWTNTGIFLLMAIICFLVSRFWNQKKRDKKGVLAGSLAILVSLFMIIRYGSAVISPEIQTYEGYFLRQNSVSRVAPFTKEYVFLDPDDPDPGFYLDTFSKKEIFPQEFDEETLYRIYYEESTKVIVRVEKVE